MVNVCESKRHGLQRQELENRLLGRISVFVLLQQLYKGCFYFRSTGFSTASTQINENIYHKSYKPILYCIVYQRIS